jgi:hypothetical protein
MIRTGTIYKKLINKVIIIKAPFAAPQELG